MTYVFVVTLLVFIVAGSIPALLGHFLLGVRFLGGPWVAALVGVIGAAIGSTVDALFLPMIPDLLVIGGATDTVPPLVSAIILVVLYGFISQSNVEQDQQG
jgi:hypothetical protein